MSTDPVDPIAHLAPTISAIACDMIGHDMGMIGCDPSQPATWIAKATHGCVPGVQEAHVETHILVCEAQATNIVKRANQYGGCDVCGVQGPLRRFLQIVDPIVPNK